MASVTVPRAPADRLAAENERVVRAAAGITMAIGAVAFAYAYFDRQYAPLQAVTALFSVEFAARLKLGLRFSPAGVLAHALSRGRPPQWVAAAPKRFAWALGLAMSLVMTVVTNSGIRGTLPRTICLVCLTLMWLEAVLGVCAGCEIAGLLARQGWVPEDSALALCAGGDCRLPAAATPDPEG